MFFASTGRSTRLGVIGKKLESVQRCLVGSGRRFFRRQVPRSLSGKGKHPRRLVCLGQGSASEGEIGFAGGQWVEKDGIRKRGKLEKQFRRNVKAFAESCNLNFVQVALAVHYFRYDARGAEYIDQVFLFKAMLIHEKHDCLDR